MRVDNNDPYQVYADFADWLRTHPVWLLNVVLAYALYPASTSEA